LQMQRKAMGRRAAAAKIPGEKICRTRKIFAANKDFRPQIILEA
jgi:hypothetical protein